MKSKWQLNPVLSTTAQRFAVNQSAYVGLRLAPPFYTGIQSAQYGVFDAENMLNVPTIRPRQPSAQAQRGQMVLSNDMFGTKEYPYEMPVDDRQRAIYANALDADNAAVTGATHIVLTNHEQRVKALADGAAIAHSTPATKWNAAGADPIGDVDAAKEVMRLACGLKPNLMTISETVFNVLKEMPIILDKIKYTQKGILTLELLAAVFGVGEIALAGVVKNVAAEGQALQPADIWGDNVYLTISNPVQDLMALNFARTFIWTQFTGRTPIAIKSRRDDDVDSDIHRAFQDADERLCGGVCGYRLEDVLA